jgi:hypothetical protein
MWDVILGIGGLVVFLACLYALIRFIKWAWRK